MTDLHVIDQSFAELRNEPPAWAFPAPPGAGKGAPDSRERPGSLRPWDEEEPGSSGGFFEGDGEMTAGRESGGYHSFPARGIEGEDICGCETAADPPTQGRTVS